MIGIEYHANPALIFSPVHITIYKKINRPGIIDREQPDIMFIVSVAREICLFLCKSKCRCEQVVTGSINIERTAPHKRDTGIIVICKNPQIPLCRNAKFEFIFHQTDIIYIEDRLHRAFIIIHIDPGRGIAEPEIFPYIIALNTRRRISLQPCAKYHRCGVLRVLRNHWFFLKQHARRKFPVA